MILAIILRDRSGSSCLNGRRRTRDWSGRRIVDVRWTRIEEAVIMDWLIWKNEPGSPQLSSTRTFFRVLPRNTPGHPESFGCSSLVDVGSMSSTHFPCRHAHQPGRLLLLP